MTDSAHTRTPADPAHTERLTVVWWGWLLPLTAAALIAAQIGMGYPGIQAWLPYVVLIPLTVLLMMLLGRIRVAVTAGAEPELWVGDAHLPLRYVSAVDVVTKQDKRHALGPDLDPAAFLVHRPWIPTMVRLHLDDPGDPTPYWLISTRHPDRIATLLLRSGAGPQPDTAQPDTAQPDTAQPGHEADDR